MILKRLVSRHLKKPLAVIIKGNPMYLEKEEIVPLADEFYNDVKSRLVKKGYRVKFDPGKSMTRPDITAKVWLGHSKGESRLKYAPPEVKTIILETKDRWNGDSPKHYQLSDKDIKNIDNLDDYIE